jgi:hypothetical protein
MSRLYHANGRERAKVMTLAIDEFIRRFLIHVLPAGTWITRISMFCSSR